MRRHLSVEPTRLNSLRILHGVSESRVSELGEGNEPWFEIIEILSHLICTAFCRP